MPRFAYHVSFDLHQKTSYYYNELDKQLELRDGVRILESSWIVKTDENANQICKCIFKHIHKDDSVFVSQINRNRQGWIANGVWPWLNQTFTANVAWINVFGF